MPRPRPQFEGGRTGHDKGQGLYDKFEVKRTDGRDGPGDKHDGCRYFVLDLDHDHYAVPALLAYADSCKDEFPELARDLYDLVEA